MEAARAVVCTGTIGCLSSSSSGAAERRRSRPTEHAQLEGGGCLVYQLLVKVDDDPILCYVRPTGSAPCLRRSRTGGYAAPR
jgi:hypothetical protein